MSKKRDKAAEQAGDAGEAASGILRTIDKLEPSKQPLTAIFLSSEQHVRLECLKLVARPMSEPGVIIEQADRLAAWVMSGEGPLIPGED